MLQSYEGVTRTIDSEFDMELGWWRQVVQLEHPRWARRTATLVNDAGALHDAGGDTLYGVFSSSGDEPGPARRDTYDLRFLGLAFPLSQLVAADSAGPGLSWIEELARLALDGVKRFDAGERQRLEYTRDDGVHVTIVLEGDAPARPVVVTQRMGEDVAETRVAYAQVAAAQSTEQGVHTASIWFPQSVSYQLTVDGEVGYHERIDVLACEFVARPDAGRFTVSSLGLPRGRRVLGDHQLQMVIDDELRMAGPRDLMNPDQTSYTIVDQAELRRPKHAGHQSMLVIINGVLLLAILFLAVLLRAVFRRR
ncbi:MAG: hypothetical protein ACF8TS_18840 [Maioricimonas sp. JB049]